VIIDNLRAQARVVVGVPVTGGADDAALRRLYDEAVRDVDEMLAGCTLPFPCRRSISTSPHHRPRDTRHMRDRSSSPMSRASANISSREIASRRSSRGGSMSRRF